MPEENKRGNNPPDLGEIVNSAIQEGIQGIVKKHPRFSGQEEFLANYLDKSKIEDYLQDYMENAKKINIKHLRKKFSQYVASGEMFNEKGKELILRKGLQEQSKKFFTGGLARRVLKGEDYLDKTMGSFNDLYNLMKSGDYAERMPELAKSVSTVYDMGFADAATNVLYQNNILDKKSYGAFKEAIKQRAEQGVKQTYKSLAEYINPSKAATTIKSLEKYIKPQKAAAAIIGLIGIGVILSTNSITGAVIGSQQTNIPSLLFGTGSLIAGIFLWFRTKLPKQIRARFLKNKESKLKLKYIEKVDSKNKNSIIDLIKKYPTRMCTLPDAFRKATSEKQIEKMDLNKRVKKITKEKLRKFKEWKKK